LSIQAFFSLLPRHLIQYILKDIDKKRKNHISNKDYIEIAEEQFARLFWRQIQYNRYKKEQRNKNKKSN